MRTLGLVLAAGLLLAAGCGKEDKGKGAADKARGTFEGLGKSLDDAAKEAQRAASEAAVKAGEAAAKAREYAKMKKEDFVAEMQKKAADLDPTIEAVKKKLGEATGEAKVDLQKLYDRLLELKKGFMEKLDGVKNASADKWQEGIAGLTSAWEELSKAAGEAKAALEKE